MHKLIFASAAATLLMLSAPASALSTGPVSPIDRTHDVIVVKHGGGHGHHFGGHRGRGHHYGWHRGRGHNYGWFRGRHRGWL